MRAGGSNEILTRCVKDLNLGLQSSFLVPIPLLAGSRFDPSNPFESSSEERNIEDDKNPP